MSENDRWRAGLLTIADEPFFDLVRNYLGPISSPFNKHTLVERLAAFLRRDDVQQAIIAALSDRDRALLAAIDLTGDATTERLLGLSALGMEAVELHHRLVNLEDRLLIYAEPHTGLLDLNPVLAPVIRGSGIGLDSLVHLEQLDAHPPDLLPINELAIAAVLSFVAEFPDPLKNDDSVKKRVAVEIATRMPLLSGDDSGTRLFAALVLALRRMGLLVGNNNTGLLIDRKALVEYGNAPIQRRLPLLWSAIALAGTGQLKNTSNETIRRIADSLTQVIGFLDSQQGAGRTAFATLLSLSAGSTVPDSLIRELCAIGLLWSPDGERFAVNPRATAMLQQKNDPAPVSNLVVLEPNYELSVSPDTAISDLAALIPLLDLRSLDLVSRYEISREGTGRGIRAGIGRSEIIPVIERLTGRPVPQNVAFSLAEWAVDYDAIGLIDCVMLTVTEERRHLVDHSSELAPFILQRPAPGVYALDRDREQQWSTVMRRIGISVLPGIAGRARPGTAEGTASRLIDSLCDTNRKPLGMFHRSSGSAGVPPRPRSGPETRSEVNSPSKTRDRERELMEKLEEAGIPESGKEELALRIRRKLVILPEQLRQGAVRPERREAKGLDYVGKVRIIEEAVKSVGIHLEIILRGRNGRPERLLMRPKSLDRKGSELVLVGTTIPDESVVRIEVGKIGLVRKLRGSLFHDTRR